VRTVCTLTSLMEWPSSAPVTLLQSATSTVLMEETEIDGKYHTYTSTFVVMELFQLMKHKCHWIMKIQTWKVLHFMTVHRIKVNNYTNIVVALYIIRAIAPTVTSCTNFTSVSTSVSTTTTPSSSSTSTPFTKGNQFILIIFNYIIC